MSVSALTKDAHLTITFFLGHFVIQDIENMKMIDKGSQFIDLYVFTASSNSNNLLHQHVTDFINTASVNTWHNRLGHLSNKCLDTLKARLSCDFSVHKHSPCYICPLAKQRKLSFVLNNNMSTLPFDFIHYDLWGPYHVPV